MRRQSERERERGLRNEIMRKEEDKGESLSVVVVVGV